MWRFIMTLAWGGQKKIGSADERRDDDLLTNDQSRVLRNGKGHGARVIYPGFNTLILSTFRQMAKAII